MAQNRESGRELHRGLAASSRRGVLVIVDMQTQFPYAGEPATIKGVKECIAKAVAAGDFIVVLEYRNMGATRPSIKAALAAYPDKRYITKTADDGAGWVARYIKSKRFTPTAFTVCGVNTQACVAGTAQGLHKAYPATPVNVVAKACNGPTTYKGQWEGNAYLQWRA